MTPTPYRCSALALILALAAAGPALAKKGDDDRAEWKHQRDSSQQIQVEDSKAYKEMTEEEREALRKKHHDDREQWHQMRDDDHHDDDDEHHGRHHGDDDSDDDGQKHKQKKKQKGKD